MGAFFDVPCDVRVGKKSPGEPGANFFLTLQL
jgi:hypothetical protein